jgi:iron(III) transport system substrate-binding protein
VVGIGALHDERVQRVSARRIQAAITLATTSVLVAACGGSPSSGTGGVATDDGPTAAEELFEAVMALSGQERRDRLVALAQEEGQLNLYTSMTSDVAEAVSEAFSDTFDIDVNLYRANGETLTQRVLQEQSAGYAGNDVVETDGIEMAALEREGVMSAYSGERRDLVPEAGVFDDWTATRFNIFTPSWNTSLVSPAEAPTSWEDLADPKWDGQLAMELGDDDWYLTLYNYWLETGKSEDEVDQLFADMADGAAAVKGHTVQAELMSAGQFAVTVSNYSYIVEKAKANGAPVDYLPFVEPAIARPNGVGLMRTATNPAAALLFTDWLLEEGQEVLTDEGLTAAIGDGSSALDELELIPVDIEAVLDNSEEWSARYDELLANATQVD